MRSYLLLYLLAIVSNALAQPTLSIGTNTRIVGTGAAQLVYGGGVLTNSGSLSLAAGQLSANGPMTYGGSGAATVANVSFGHSTGSSTLNSLLSVTNRATLSANTTLNANGQLYLRTDQFPNADLVNNGILTGTVQGLVTKASVTAGATAYNSQLTTNVSGSSMQYQWQSSANNSEWSNVPGATSATYTASVNTSIYYRCLLSTTNSSYGQNTPAVLLTFTGTQPLILTTLAQPNPVNAGSTIALTASASGGTPSYTYAWNAPAGISLSAINTSAVSGTVGAGISGIQTLTVTVTDATMPVSQTISATVSVTVTQANRPPVAPTYVNQTVMVGTPFSYRVLGFTDPDGDPVNYSVSIDPVNGFSFDPSWPTVVGTPIATGVSTVTVTGTDPGNLSTSATFTITVIPAVLIRYVTEGGTGDGSSWTNASGDLQAMINAPGVQQVWVASGIFRPTTGLQNPRRASFRMKNNVAIYGGFTGTETSLSARPAIDPLAGKPSSTTLSGDIGKVNDNSDNSYHVFYHFYDNPLNSTAVLDGVVITDGNANAYGSYTDIGDGFAESGGGILNVNSSPTLTNCSLLNNSAKSNGGAILNQGSSPVLTNCSLQGNSASSGGGIYNMNDSSPTLTNCSLINNSAVNNGGGLFNLNGSTPTLTNCSLINNSAILGGALSNIGSNPTLVNCNLQNNSSKEQGGALYNGGSNPTLVNCSLLGNAAPEGGALYNGGSNPVLANCVVWNNGAGKTIFNNSSSVTATYSLFDNTVTGYTGTNNKTTTTTPFASGDPATPAGIALAPSSPAIDAGNNQAYTSANGPGTDLAGNPRFFPKEGMIDMGAVEFQTDPIVSSPFSITGVTTVSCTVLSAGQRQLSFTPRYSGLSGQPVSFSVANELSPTTAPGPYSLKVYTDNPIITLKAVQTGTAGEASFAYNWLAACNTGGNPPANQAPTTTGIANQAATVGQAFSLNIAPFFTDPNGDVLSYQADGLPAGLSLNGSTISGIAGVSSVSSVTVTATDPGSLSVRAIFDLTVNPATAPNPPTTPFSITGVTTVSCTVLSAGQRQLSFTPRYSGLSGQPVSFSVVNELLPTTAPGPYSITLYTDNPIITLQAQQGSLQASYRYEWLVACNTGGNPPANQAPTTTGIATQTATVGQAFSLNVAPFFTDPNGDVLSYQADGLPAGLSLNGSTISGIAGVSSVSSVTVTATDPGSLSVRAIFDLTVNPATAPNPPTTPFSITGVTTVSCTVLSAGQRQLSFTPRYSGLSGQPVSFSVVNELLPTTAPGPYSITLYTDNPIITLQAQQGSLQASYRYEWLGACTARSRQSAAELSSPLQVTVLGNPIVGQQVMVEVRGAQGQLLQLTLTNLQGQVMSERVVEQAGSVETQSLPVSAQPAGLLLLRVSTSTQSQLLKVLNR